MDNKTTTPDQSGQPDNPATSAPPTVPGHGMASTSSDDLEKRHQRCRCEGTASETARIEEVAGWINGTLCRTPPNAEDFEQGAYIRALLLQGYCTNRAHADRAEERRPRRHG